MHLFFRGGGIRVIYLYYYANDWFEYGAIGRCSETNERSEYTSYSRQCNNRLNKKMDGCKAEQLRCQSTTLPYGAAWVAGTARCDRVVAICGAGVGSDTLC